MNKIRMGLSNHQAVLKLLEFYFAKELKFMLLTRYSALNKYSTRNLTG